MERKLFGHVKWFASSICVPCSVKHLTFSVKLLNKLDNILVFSLRKYILQNHLDVRGCI
jgi:hypothetical protein